MDSVGKRGSARQRRRRLEGSPQEMKGIGDGRVCRGRRNRQRILDAIYDLVKGGAIEPTGEQIAARAGVGARSVFRHFEDMEGLHADMGARVAAEVLAITAPAPGSSGPLEERVRALVRHRARIYEHIAPFRRAAALQRHRSEILRRGQAELAERMRTLLDQALGAELTGLPDELHEAADAMASFEAWERLRGEQKLGRERAARVVEAALLALLGRR